MHVPPVADQTRALFATSMHVGQVTAVTFAVVSVTVIHSTMFVGPYDKVRFCPMCWYACKAFSNIVHF